MSKEKLFNKWNLIKQEFVAWSLLTKFDCFSKIFHEKHAYLKIVWLCFFLIFTSFTGYFVCKNIIDYCAFEIVSKIELIDEKPTEFPVITICDPNPLSSTAAQNLISNITRKNYGKDIEAFNSSEIIAHFPNVYELTRMYIGQTEYGTANRKHLTNGFLLVNCFFNNVKCSIDDFPVRYYFRYGACWQFNRNLPSLANIRETITEGPFNGLSLVMFVNKTQTKYPNMNGVGLKLFIHNKTFENRLTEEINLKMGEEINVAVSRTFSYKTPHPYSECEDLDSFRSEYFNILKSSNAALNASYRQYDCFKLCLQKMITQNCECHFTKFTKVENLPSCLNLSQFNCTNTQQNAFTGEKLIECNKQCPLECNTITYSPQLSTLDFPSHDLFKLYQNESDLGLGSMSFDTMKNSLISLKVYYPFTQYTEIRELPKTSLIDLISQIGGSLGMLLGFSIFHLIELFEIIILIVFHFLQK